jgi:hypothetical protein
LRIAIVNDLALAITSIRRLVEHDGQQRLASVACDALEALALDQPHRQHAAARQVPHLEPVLIAVAVLLTGMGRDGGKGMLALLRAGWPRSPRARPAVPCTACRRLPWNWAGGAGAATGSDR